MEDPLLQMAGLPGMRPLGDGPLPDDGVDRTPTERHIYNTRESSLASYATNRNTFLGLPCDHKDQWHRGQYHWTAPSKTRFVPCGQKVPYYFNGYSCSPDWYYSTSPKFRDYAHTHFRLLKNLMALPLLIRENIFEIVINCVYSGDIQSLLYWVTTDEIPTHPLGLDTSEARTKYDIVPTLENKISNWWNCSVGEFCWVRGFAEALRRRENDGSQEARDVLIDFLGFISRRVVWCVKCGNECWVNDNNTPMIEKSLTWLKRNKLFYPCMKHISIDFEPRDEFNVPFAEDFVALCNYMSANLPNLESVILWLKITEDDFREVLKSPMGFSWVRAFKELPLQKVEICPLLTDLDESNEARVRRLQYPIGSRLDYFIEGHHMLDSLRSLLLNDPNKERVLISHILTPGSKLWGFTDDIDEDAYISLQYMESWLSYTDDVADDAYISLQYMESWNVVREKSILRTPRRFKNMKANGKFLRLRQYQLPRQSPPNQQVLPLEALLECPQESFRNLLPGNGWPRSAWYQMKL
ncbi:hypothetical protein EAF04_001585 [Stromatinia cepivora]|nr:hypothetical protein EAF04_001585 [Stromatinia cepivora]